MPRVEVLIRVLDDEGAGIARSTFSIGDNATTVLTEQVSPVELVQDLGEIFVTSLQDQFPNIGFQVLPGELHVTSRLELPESLRENLQRRLAPFARHPDTPEIRAAVRREIEAFRAEYPEQMVVPPSMDPNAQIDLSGIDFAGMEYRLIARGIRPEVSMGTGMLDPHEADPHFEDPFQAPAPPNESNPVSRRIRGALRAVVGEQMDERTRMLTHLSERGMVSRRTLLEYFGLTEDSTRQELEEALGRQNQAPPPPDPVRGRLTVGAMLDDAAHFDAGTPVFASDRHVADPPTDRQSVALEHFRTIYGGDPVSRPATQRNFQRVVRAKKGSPPPEDRTTIPTRYHRKPVI